MIFEKKNKCDEIEESVNESVNVVVYTFSERKIKKKTTMRVSKENNRALILKHVRLSKM